MAKPDEYDYDYWDMNEEDDMSDLWTFTMGFLIAAAAIIAAIALAIHVAGGLCRLM